MFKRLMCLTVFAMIFIGHSAHAADPGWYLGGGLGAYTLDIDDTDFDDNATVLRVVGGYQLNDFLAIEADYQKLFDVEDDVIGIDTEINADVWGIALRPMIPITDFIDIYAKVGYAWYDIDAEVSIAGAQFTEGDSDSALNWGGGVDFNFGALSLRGEVSRIEVDDADLNLVSASVLFRF